MSKGLALIEARKMFGSAGFVRYGVASSPEEICQVGVFGEHGWIPLGKARTWLAALGAADDARVVREGL